MFATRDRGNVRIVSKGTESEGKAFEVIVIDSLVGEGKHMVLEPCSTKRFNDFLIKWPR